MNEKELKQLAIDIVENKVFGTWQMNENDLSHMHIVFMPLIAISDETKQEMRSNNTIHLYEYYDKAGPRSVNGMPCFFSFRSISKDDWDKVLKYAKEYEIRVKSFLNKNEKKEPEGPTLFDGVKNEDNKQD